jgi:hypothetical protein
MPPLHPFNKNYAYLLSNLLSCVGIVEERTERANFQKNVISASNCPSFVSLQEISIRLEFEGAIASE